MYEQTHPMRGGVIHVGTDMELDPYGSPMAPQFTGAEIEVKQETGLDLSKGDPGMPYASIVIEANRAGLLSLGYRLVAMAHARPDAEECGFHLHLLDGLGWDSMSPGERGFEVTIKLEPSKDK